MNLMTWICLLTSLPTGYRRWLFFSLLSVSPTDSCTGLVWNKKKMSITQHISVPQSRWEIMPHTFTLSNSFAQALFWPKPHYSCSRMDLNILAVTPKAAHRCLVFGLCHCNWGNTSLVIQSIMLAQKIIRLYMCRRGEERSRFQQLSSPPTDMSRLPKREGLFTEGQRDTCGRQHLTRAHTQLCGILFILARPLAPNVDGMFDCPPLAPFRHDVIPRKCHLFKEE